MDTKTVVAELLSLSPRAFHVCCSISGLWLHCGPLEYRPVIDPKSVADSQKLEGDLEECRVLSDSVDYSDEKTIAALKGAGVTV